MAHRRVMPCHAVRRWDDGTARSGDGSAQISINTIRAFLFMAGLTTDIYSSIDISVAFLQANPYDDDAPKRYVVYKPHKYALIARALPLAIIGPGGPAGRIPHAGQLARFTH